MDRKRIRKVPERFHDEGETERTDNDIHTISSDSEPEEGEHDSTYELDHTSNKRLLPVWQSLRRDELIVEHQRLIENHESVVTEFKAHKKKAAGERKIRVTKAQECREVKTGLKVAKEENQKLHKEFDQLRRDHATALKRVEDDFARAERSLLAKAKSDVWPLKPDDFIRDKLREILLRCRDWVKAWRGTELELWESDLRALTKACMVHKHRKTTQTLLGTIGANTSLAHNLAGQAWLTKTMLEDFICQPFLLFDLLEGNNCDQSLAQTYEIMRSTNLKKACSWRADAVRLLKSSLISRGIIVAGETSPRLDEFCKVRASETYDKMKRGILRSVEIAEASRRDKELYRLYYDAALLWLDIWSHKSDIRLIAQLQLDQIKFSTDSDLYEPHASMGLEPEDTVCEGTDIDMIITPAIEVTGDAEGNNFDSTKIWSKMIVLIVDKNPLSAKNNLVDTSGKLKSESKRVSEDCEQNQAKRSKTQLIELTSPSPSHEAETDMPLAADEGDAFQGLIQSSEPALVSDSLLSEHSQSSSHDASTLSQKVSTVVKADGDQSLPQTLTDLDDGHDIKYKACDSMITSGM